MADDINKKITIDVEINTDGQQQITQYKAAFDNFRSSLNSIKNPLQGIASDFKTLNKSVTDITSSLNKLNNTTGSFNSTGSKIGGIVNNVISSFVGLNVIFTELKIAFGALTAELTGGLSLLISFLPVIVDWVSDLFNADTQTKSLTQTLKEHKSALDAVRQAHLQGSQDAQEELTHLKLLYNASQDHNLSLADRKKIIGELQSQYPQYFGNLSTEAILLGKATKQYNSLTKAILATARAKAAEDMMVTNSKRQLTDSMHKDDLQKQIDEKQKQLKTLDQQYQNQLFSGAYGDARKGYAANKIKDNMDQLTREIILLQTEFSHADTDSKILDQWNNQLADDVASNVEANGAGVLGNTGSGTQATPKTANRSTKTPPASTPTAVKFPMAKNNTDDADTIPDDLNAANDAYMEQQAQKEKEQALKTTQDIITGANAIKAANQAKEDQQRQQRDQQRVAEAKKVARQIGADALSVLQNSIKQQADAKVAALEKDKAAELSNTSLTGTQKAAIQQKYQQEENQVRAKAFKEEQELNIAQAIMNGALAITKVTAQDGVLAALEIGGVVAETAAQVAKIASQKPPAYAKGGLHYASDGRGGLLPGYSRTDNTNAFLRSGEGIVVSEAMREPWARNLVSAINVGFGGRDFSTAATGKGFAVGGIFTDGGNANRYYNQPVNDNKNLANTIAYQMINNFPPVYVDVKDINNQQNILAQTINRVNL